MVQIVQHRRRINGASGAPATTGSKEGELVINFPNAAGTNAQPELWAYDGAGFRRVNPPGATPRVRSIGAVAAGATVEAAFNADKPSVAASDIVIYTWNGAAYIYTGGAGTNITTATPGDFTNLGAATNFATPAQARAGTSNALAISPAALAGILPVPVLAAGTTGAQTGHPTNPAAATGAASDANRIVTLDSTGHIPSGLVSLSGFAFAAGNLAAAPTPAMAHKPGLIVVHTGTDGATLNAGFTPMAPGSPTTVQKGDMLLSDDKGVWHHLENKADLSNYLPLSGGTLRGPAAAAGAPTLQFDMTNAVASAGTATDPSVKVAIDAGGGALINGIIDGGLF